MKLSIITINFNNRDGLRKTIESVVNQTWQEFEYIIIDGGSTDGSVEVIKEFADRIDYWVSEPDKGIYNAMNKGIDKATGEYCLFMNSGDWLYSNDILQTINNELCNIDIISGDMQYTTGYTKLSPSTISFRFLYTNSLPHQSSFIRTELLKNNPYDEKYKVISDWIFFIKTLIIQEGSYKHVNVIISLFDTSGISETNLSLNIKERKKYLCSKFPSWMLRDYEHFTNGSEWDEKLYIKFRRSKYRRTIYSLLIYPLKVIGLFTAKSHWVNKFPSRL